MSLHINDAGTWRTIREVHINDNGTWRQIIQAWVNDAGTWRSIFEGDIITISDRTASATQAGSAVARYQLDSTGDINATAFPATLSDVGDWITPKVNMALYECRATLVSGTLLSGTTGSWLSLSTLREWTRGATSGQSNQTVFTLEIRRASDGVVLDTATITLSASAF